MRSVVCLCLTIGVLCNVIAACGGQLFIPESDISKREDPTHKPCTLVNPEGRCPDGLECCSGVCAASCEAWMCNCDPQQACVSGECTDITEENCCSSERPEGLCPMGQVCLGGTCVPLSGVCGCEDGWACVNGECVEIKPGEECTTDRPTGLCPDGEVCIGGECLPINNLCSQDNCNGLCPSGSTCSGCRCVPIDRPCSLSEPDGQCPSCYTCEPPGECVIVECSPEAPHCACPNVDEYCDNGECKAFPCSPGHTEGECPDDEVCCSEGRCVAEGGCCADADCQGNTKCSKCEPMCINLDSCLCNDDCEPHYTCESQVCVRDLSCPNGDSSECLDGEICDSTGQCRPEGTCGVDADCREAGEYCSVCGECLAMGVCCEDDDCAVTEYCSSANTCLTPPACAGDIDCDPGYTCDDASFECLPGGVSCTANGGASCVSAGGETFWCCPTGETCCEQGQRCSDQTHTCIVDGQCVDDGDCLTPYFTCDTGSHTCVPVTACSGNTCGSGQTCSQAGGCIPDDGTCVADSDCEDGEVCNALFQCEPRVGCGSQEFEATLVPPNMLIVLDRSGSMNYCLACPTEQQACDDAPGCHWDGSTCVDDCSGYSNQSQCNADNACGWDNPGHSGHCRPAITRLATAHSAIDSVVSAYEDQIRFGLSLYPLPCTGSCTEACHFTDYCTSCGATAGTVEVAVNSGTKDAIMLEIGGTFPGGNTPTAPTLRAVEADRNAFGLPSDADPVTRSNYIMLVTDGDANSGGSDSNCGSNPSEADLVNCVVERLQQATVPVRTYVVGFAFGGSPGNLNCHAYYGGTARSDTCPNITESDCSSGGAGSTGPCYYPADNEQQLVDAMSNIVGQVASCTYSLDQVPQEPDRLFVYFYYGCADITDPDQCTSAPGCGLESGECVGEPMWLERDPSHIDNWDYDPQNNQILFFGSACEEVKAGLVTPVVIMGCCEGGEC